MNETEASPRRNYSHVDPRFSGTTSESEQDQTGDLEGRRLRFSEYERIPEAQDDSSDKDLATSTETSDEQLATESDNDELQFRSDSTDSNERDRSTERNDDAMLNLDSGEAGRHAWDEGEQSVQRFLQLIRKDDLDFVRSNSRNDDSARRTTSGESLDRAGLFFPRNQELVQSSSNNEDLGDRSLRNHLGNVAVETSRNREEVGAVRSEATAAAASKNPVTSAKGRFYSLNVSSSIRGMSHTERAMKARLIDRRSSLFSDGGTGVRRKRYTNYYSPQSVIPMAYVHIQPAYPVPAPPPANRKCVRCMVVYKPCPPQQRQPPRIILPNQARYQDVAMKWHGLKYGESIDRC